MNFPEIRVDDVLQVSGISKHQTKEIGGHKLYDLFLASDKIFRHADYPCILAICADGIKKEPEWVDYIKRNLYRYKLELHCYHHQNYKFMPREKIIKDLDKAINLIHNTFGVEPTTWYPPKGRKGEPNDKDGICYQLGIKCYQQIGKVDAKLWFRNPNNYPHVNFHYWSNKQIDHVKQILDLWLLQQDKL